MKSVKKMLMGIAIILFGIALASAGEGGEVFCIAGWIIALLGLFMSFVGYYFTEDDKDDEGTP